MGAPEPTKLTFREEVELWGLEVMVTWEVLTVQAGVMEAWTGHQRGRSQEGVLYDLAPDWLWVKRIRGKEEAGTWE